MSKKAKKRKTTGKTTKSNKRRRTLPLSPQGIGVLSSIPFNNTRLQTAFEAGLASRGIYFNIRDGNGMGLGYDPGVLQNNLQILNSDGNVGLIVAVGGSITHAAAMQSVGGAVLPFISIVGGRFGLFPGLNTGQFRGGTSVESVSRDGQRIDDLKARFNINTNDEICLLYNTNSAMSPNESLLLNRSHPITVGQNTANPRNVFDQAFTAISNMRNPSIKAVLVSADPWFTQRAGDLVPAANHWVSILPAQRAVCYPLQDYLLQNPTPRRRLLRGPSLEKVYKNLGKQAKNILAGGGGSNDDANEEINT